MRYYQLYENWLEDMQRDAAEAHKVMDELRRLPAKAYEEQAAFEGRIVMALIRIESKLAALKQSGEMGEVA